MTKKLIIGFLVIVLLAFGIYFFNKNKQPTGEKLEQEVLEKTLSISQDYAVLRFKSDNVLIKAKDFGDYDKWNSELTKIIEAWEKLEKEATELEKQSEKLDQEEISFNLSNDVFAYDSQEVMGVINSAKPNKRIATLAKHLGVDAKMAQLILNQTQDQSSRDAYGGEGDVASTYETSAMRIKNGAKVTVYVGTVIATGGVTGVVGSGAIATAGTVVAGADLALEITEDEARIALGDKNKVTEMAGSIRSVTEPAAGILAIVNIPGNLSKAIDKFSAFSLAVDQTRSAIQDKKIIGISIKTNDKGEVKAEVAGLTPEDLPTWRQENNGVKSNETTEEIINSIEEKKAEEEKIVAEEEKQIEKVKENKKVDNNSSQSSNQIIKIVNVSGSSYMMDACYTPTCWDDLNADPVKDRDLGGIYTMGKVFGNGESFKTGFRPSDLKAAGRLEETSANSYKTNIYLAIFPHEGENKIINYGTWLNESAEINAKYGDEVVIEWDEGELKQVK